ncbi:MULTISPECIES: hypothetical protein [unclassified Methylomonas]|uniref:hypothetical protein n=1 Tax=unclassified Methylomonas TaxID=2608980 RepID=UPI000A56FB38|nr:MULTISPECIES: hypothetical protein [unclassified Methylomonas]MDT4332572.1 hypothetical protein [Methylomonas sp. MV1]NJA07659.1 hypothetical protein [Methylococcaceae bacterium WWC4]WGS85269.1 hypothetical protein QC632_19815 [Methylomonas sp. UP202]
MHGLLASQRPAANSNHSGGTAFDARVTLPADQNVDAIAGTVNLTGFDPVHDRVSFGL